VPHGEFEVLLRDGLSASKAVVVVQEASAESFAI